MPYPTSYDVFAPHGTLMNEAPTHDNVHLAVESSIVSIEGELGLNPSGPQATVAARLNAIEAADAAQAAAVAAQIALLPIGNKTRVQVSSNQSGFTSPAIPSGFEATFTAVAGRLYRLSFSVMVSQVTSTGNAVVYFGKGGSTFRYGWQGALAAGETAVVSGFAYDTPTAGSVTYSVMLSTSAGSLTHNGATSPGQLLVEDIGQA